MAGEGKTQSELGVTFSTSNTTVYSAPAVCILIFADLLALLAHASRMQNCRKETRASRLQVVMNPNRMGVEANLFRARSNSSFLLARVENFHLPLIPSITTTQAISTGTDTNDTQLHLDELRLYSDIFSYNRKIQIILEARRVSLNFIITWIFN